MLNLVDGILIVVVLSGAVTGFRQGFVLAAFSLVGAVSCAVAAFLVAPLIVQRMDSGIARTAASLALLVVGVLAGEILGGLVGRSVSDRITWSPARAVDRSLGALGQGIAVLGFAWIVAVPIASAPLPGLASAIRNSAVLSAVDGVAPEGAIGITNRLRTLLNSTGFPDILGPLGATPRVSVPTPNTDLVDDPVIAAAQPSVLRIRAIASDCNSASTGSGFVFAPERVLTNAHVVAGSTFVEVESGSTQLTATVVDYDSERDLAVLYVPGLNLPVLPVAGGELAEQADAAVLGYPLGGPFTVSAGRVRTVVDLSGPDIYQSKTVNRQVYLLRALVRPGNSGGPVLDEAGRVVGVIFGAAIDDAETGFALTAAEIASTVSAGREDSSVDGTGACLRK